MLYHISQSTRVLLLAEMTCVWLSPNISSFPSLRAKNAMQPPGKIVPLWLCFNCLVQDKCNHMMQNCSMQPVFSHVCHVCHVCPQFEESQHWIVCGCPCLPFTITGLVLRFWTWNSNWTSKNTWNVSIVISIPRTVKTLHGRLTKTNHVMSCRSAACAALFRPPETTLTTSMFA